VAIWLLSNTINRHTGTPDTIYRFSDKELKGYNRFNKVYHNPNACTSKMSPISNNLDIQHCFHMYLKSPVSSNFLH
jgi:hypothetical protein